MFAVTVTFRVKDDELSAFLPRLRENAATSLRVEKGCIVFDICTDPDRPTEVFLYELYADAAAFDDHVASDHFREFDRRTVDMIVDKSARTFREVRR